MVVHFSEGIATTGGPAAWTVLDDADVEHTPQFAIPYNNSNVLLTNNTLLPPRVPVAVRTGYPTTTGTTDSGRLLAVHPHAAVRSI